MRSGAVEVARAHAVESGRPTRGDLAQGDGGTPAARLAAERHRRGWRVGGDDFPLRRGGWSDVGGLYAAAPEERRFGRARPAEDGNAEAGRRLPAADAERSARRPTGLRAGQRLRRRPIITESTGRRCLSRHCEELLRRSNPGPRDAAPGLLRCARNDGWGVGSFISGRRLMSGGDGPCGQRSACRIMLSCDHPPGRKASGAPLLAARRTLDKSRAPSYYTVLLNI